MGKTMAYGGNVDRGAAGHVNAITEPREGREAGIPEFDTSFRHYERCFGVRLEICSFELWVDARSNDGNSVLIWAAFYRLSDL